MKLFRGYSFNLVGAHKSSLRKISSCPGNLEKYKIAKLINEQSIESVIEETVEIYQDNDPYLKLLTVFLFTFTKNVKSAINFKIVEAKIKEVIIRMTIQYFIHEFFHIAKTYIACIN